MNVTIPYSIPDTATIWRAGWDPLAFTGTSALMAWAFVVATTLVIVVLTSIATVGYNANLASWQKPRHWGIIVPIVALVWAVCAWLAASYFVSNQTTQVVMDVPHTVGTSYHPTTTATQAQRDALGKTRHDINVATADSLIRSQIVMTYGFTVTSTDSLGNVINPHSPIDSAKLVVSAADGSHLDCVVKKKGDHGTDRLGRNAQAVMTLNCNNG